MTDAWTVLRWFLDSHAKARNIHAPMHSTHEGYAVLLEELDELWDEVKADDYEAAREEAIHLGAMALAFLLEVPPPERQPRKALATEEEA